MSFKSKQPVGFFKAESDVHALQRLSGGAFGQVVDCPGQYDFTGMIVEAEPDFANIGHGNVFGVGKAAFRQHADKMLFRICLVQNLFDFFHGAAWIGIQQDRGVYPAGDGDKMRYEIDCNFALRTDGGGKLLLDFRQMAMSGN